MKHHNHRPHLLLLAMGLVACPSAPGLDDEADTTTSQDATTSSETETASSDTASSETTSNDTETASSDTESNDFAPVPDSPGCGDFECDPLCAPSCPEGEKCVAHSSEGGAWDANKCVPVVGAGAPGDACTWTGPVEAIDDCGADSWCWNAIEVEGQLVGTCAAVCTGDLEAPVCAEGFDCLIANEASIVLCLQTCDPLAGDCGAGLGCFAEPTLAGGFDFHCIAAPANLPSGEPCEFANECAPGHLCIEGGASCEGTACCAAYCDLTEPSCAAPASECAAMFDEGMAPLGLEDVGVCVLPGSIIDLVATNVTP